MESRSIQACLYTAGMCLFLLILNTRVASAQDIGPGLSGLTYQNQVETAAAAANQVAFNALDAACNGTGSGTPTRFDLDPFPVYDPSLVFSPTCTADAFAVYLVTRELVHTANALQGAGPTVASLDLDLGGLGRALRWTAAEEFAAQGSMATDFANGQLSNLASRLNALRFGARGFGLVAGNAAQQVNGQRMASVSGRSGGGASADSNEQYSPWGGFINGAHGWGNKSPTPLEDAFEFDGSEVTAGIDYRFNNNIVLGGIFGYSEQSVDFDESASTVSVVDGGIDADGLSYLGFVLFQGEGLAFSASLGYQTLEYDAERRIRYPSFNPGVPSVDATSTSSPESSALMGTLNIGYAFTHDRWTFEPYANVQYMDVSVDAFAETRGSNSLSTPDTRDFTLRIAEQDIQTLDSAVGLRVQVAITPDFGVIVPYVAYEFHRESEDNARTISARYDGLEAFSFGGFEVPTDIPDSSYYKSMAGFSVVLRGGRQRTQGGVVFGGVQGFMQYTRISGLANYEDQVVTGGLRYEF